MQTEKKVTGSSYLYDEIGLSVIAKSQCFRGNKRATLLKMLCSIKNTPRILGCHAVPVRGACVTPCTRELSIPLLPAPDWFSWCLVHLQLRCKALTRSSACFLVGQHCCQKSSCRRLPEWRDLCQSHVVMIPVLRL